QRPRRARVPARRVAAREEEATPGLPRAEAPPRRARRRLPRAEGRPRRRRAGGRRAPPPRRRAREARVAPRSRRRVALPPRLQRRLRLGRVRARDAGLLRHQLLLARRRPLLHAPRGGALRLARRAAPGRG